MAVSERILRATCSWPKPAAPRSTRRGLAAAAGFALVAVVAFGVFWIADKQRPSDAEKFTPATQEAPKAEQAPEPAMKNPDRSGRQVLKPQAAADAQKEPSAKVPEPESKKAEVTASPRQVPSAAQGSCEIAATSESAPPSIKREPGELALDSFGVHYRWIPGGAYTIGSPAEDKERDSDEARRNVNIEGLWLAETEVTQAFWKQHVPNNPSKFGDCAECPVERVSWYEAVKFANLLSEKAGLESCYEHSCTGNLGEASFTCSKANLKGADCTGYRLPTEAEWEVAAQAQEAGSRYQARYGKVEEIAWYGDNSGGKTHPVGQKAANVWGLRDMLGNVWEWTGDLNDPKGSDRVIRGGSWFHDARNVRAAYRGRCEPGFRDGLLGFRFSLGRPRSGEERRGAR